MSLDQLPAVMAQRSFAYVVSVSDEGQAHVLAVQVAADGDDLVMDVGRRTSSNVASRVEVMLVFPPADSSESVTVDHPTYSLVVDGIGRVADGRLRVRPTSAVMHRPAPPFAASAAAPATATATDTDPRSAS